ncbi:MAG: GNAT family N-acetyltransferase [Acidimicrobiia bacterium]|nr:GNAT family N-acetyltransferase [Acidimicrobiia bacterium]
MAIRLPVMDLVEITDENWRAVADVAPRDDQRRYVAALAASYLLLSDRERVWTSLGISEGDQIVGHIMWGEEEGIAWIGGMVIDSEYQRRGFGRAAMERMLHRLPHREVRLSVHPDNTAAIALYDELGFKPTNMWDDDEQVYALRR